MNFITAWQQQRSGLPDRTWQFGYDDVNQLTSAVLEDPQDAILQTLDWTYDPAGNRIGEEVDDGVLVPSRHNELNQLTEDGGGPIRFAGTLDEPGKEWVDGSAYEEFTGLRGLAQRTTSTSSPTSGTEKTRWPIGATFCADSHP